MFFRISALLTEFEKKKASADKGGYREQAIDSVRDAISETQQGIDYDRRN